MNKVSLVAMAREQSRKAVQAKAELAADERLVSALVGEGASGETRMKFRRLLREGSLESREIEVHVADAGGGMPIGMMDLPGAQGCSLLFVHLVQRLPQQMDFAAAAIIQPGQNAQQR